MGVIEADNGEPYEALRPAIDSEIQQIRDRAASLEQRALAVVTTSGVLVSLLFGFSALIKGKGISQLPLAARNFLSVLSHS